MCCVSQENTRNGAHPGHGTYNRYPEERASEVYRYLIGGSSANDTLGSADDSEVVYQVPKNRGKVRDEQVLPSPIATLDVHNTDNSAHGVSVSDNVGYSDGDESETHEYINSVYQVPRYRRGVKVAPVSPLPTDTTEMPAFDYFPRKMHNAGMPVTYSDESEVELSLKSVYEVPKPRRDVEIVPVSPLSTVYTGAREAFDYSPQATHYLRMGMTGDDNSELELSMNSMYEVPRHQKGVMVVPVSPLSTESSEEQDSDYSPKKIPNTDDMDVEIASDNESEGKLPAANECHGSETPRTRPKFREHSFSMGKHHGYVDMDTPISLQPKCNEGDYENVTEFSFDASNICESSSEHKYVNTNTQRNSRVRFSALEKLAQYSVDKNVYINDHTESDYETMIKRYSTAEGLPFHREYINAKPRFGSCFARYSEGKCEIPAESFSPEMLAQMTVNRNVYVNDRIAEETPP